MRQQLTRQDIFKMYDNVYTCGYCALQEIETELKCIGYNSGIYGWNWDAYEIDANTVLVTGYRNLPAGRYLQRNACAIIRQEYAGGIELVKAMFNQFNQLYQ